MTIHGGMVIRSQMAATGVAYSYALPFKYQRKVAHSPEDN